MRRRRNADRSGKGLRHFSMKVCKKVEEKGTTTYNEVADELVEEVIIIVKVHCNVYAFHNRHFFLTMNMNEVFHSLCDNCCKTTI